MTDQPTLLKDMAKDEQKEILFAWYRKKPLQVWSGREWIDRGDSDTHPLEDLAYRIKPEPEPNKLYLNLLPGQGFYPTLEMADAAAEAHDRIACVRAQWADLYIDWTEDQLDE